MQYDEWNKWGKININGNALKSVSPSLTEIQLCTLATIRRYFEAAERATTLIFFPQGSLRASSQHYRAIFLEDTGTPY